MQELHASIRTQLAVQAPDLRALAHRLTSGPEAEDCVQNTMVVALSQHEPPRKLRPWLRKVLRNEIHAHHRVGARRRHREHQVVCEPMPTLDDHAAREQIATALRMVLDALEEPYRSVLRRRFLLEHPATRIARDEGCSPATVRWRVHEGLRRMRRMLDERFAGRQQWLGGVAWLAGGPVEGAAPVTGEGANATMTEATITTGSILTKIALAGIAAGGVAMLAGGTVEATPAAALDRARPGLAADLVPASTTPILGADAIASPPCDDRSCEPGSASEPTEADTAGAEAEADADADADAGPTFVGGQASGDVWKAALQQCQTALGSDYEGKRIELDIEVVGGAVGEPAYFERLVVTTGRDFPCVEPVEERSPIDAEGVEIHTELAECLEATLDAEQLFGPLMPGEARGFGMVFLDESEPPPPVAGGELPAPDPALAALEPERAPAALALPGRGSTDDEAISVVECVDYDCPFCRRAQASLDQLLDQHPEVSLHVLSNPLSMHRTAPLAARAAVAAGDQGRFWAMHEALFEDPQARTVKALVAEAEALGLDVERFERDLLSEEVGRRVATQAAICSNAGARGTPSFFVGGDLVVGAQGYEALAEAVEFEQSQRR